MIKKFVIFVLSLTFSYQVLADTLYVTTQLLDESQPRIATYTGVADYGYHDNGTFVVRLLSGQEVTFAPRNHWRKFGYYYIPDAEQLIKP